MAGAAIGRKAARQTFVSVYPFELLNGGLGVPLSLTTTSGTSSRMALPEGGSEQMLVSNVGPYTAFLRFGNSSVEATTACVAIFPGIPYTLTLGEDESADMPTHVAGITLTGTAFVQICRGHGN